MFGGARETIAPYVNEMKGGEVPVLNLMDAMANSTLLDLEANAGGPLTCSVVTAWLRRVTDWPVV